MAIVTATLFIERIVPFVDSIAPQFDFAVWAGVSDAVDPGTPRTSEVCVNVPGGERQSRAVRHAVAPAAAR